jgi:hypothetical protein
MPILIACSPSTGSSLLRRILNRHSQVFCGPETSLLAKKEFYYGWNVYKNKFLQKKTNNLVNVGWHHMKGLNLQDENDLSNSDLIRLASESDSFSDFVNEYFDCLLQSSQKTIWAEKTPSNAFAIDDFKSVFPDSKVIHIVRNPYDTIASLVNRGMSVFNAVSVYLLNVCQCLEHKSKPYYYEVRYEDLVGNPKESIVKLCQFLEIEYENGMILTSRNEKGVDHMKGWNYKETAQIGKKSVGRFDKLPDQTKTLIQEGMNNMYSTLVQTNNCYNDIFIALKYVKKDVKLSVSYYFQREMVKDKFKRLVKKSYFRSHNYPLKWNN